MIIINSQLTINYLQDTVNQSYGTLVTQFSIFICIIRFPVYGTSIASYLHIYINNTTGNGMYTMYQNRVYALGHSGSLCISIMYLL